MNLKALKSSKHKVPEERVHFAHCLASIFQRVTGQTPTTTERKPSDPDDWKTDFVGFVSEVWPLTCEGSAGMQPPSADELGRWLKKPNPC